VAAAAPEETDEAACEGANGEAAVAKSAKSISCCQYCAWSIGCGGRLTSIAGNSRRDGRSASEEAFEKIGHGVGGLVVRAGDGGEEIPRCSCAV
jgi:hypothetical protein